jgi:hypothetical protein
MSEKHPLEKIAYRLAWLHVNVGVTNVLLTVIIALLILGMK